MVLLSLGSEALIALLRTNERNAAPGPRPSLPEAHTPLPPKPGEVLSFSSFLQSSN